MTATTAGRPVIAGFHPDPSVCRVGTDYFLVNSSFEYVPGIPVFTSQDLLAWTLVGNALDRETQLPAGVRGPSQGIFAPTIRHHDGRFFLITTDLAPDPAGHVLFTADTASGPWSDPIRIPLVGIDPDIAWDDEGNCYVTWCRSGPDLPLDEVHIEQARIDPGTGDVLELPRRLWSGTGLAHPEGPHLYRHGTDWILLIAEGGTERGHAVSIARGPTIEGPFEGAPHNPVLSHRSTTHPVQNTGHADLIELADGSWAIVFLGVRPRGMSPGFHVNGRETFIAGIDWVDGWPRVIEGRLEGDVVPTAFDDRFIGDTLDPRWISAGARPRDAARPHPAGGVALRPVPSPNGEPATIGVRAADPYWEARVDLESAGGRVDVVLRVDDVHRAQVQLADGVASATLRIGPLESSISERIPVRGRNATVVVRARPAEGWGPDEIEFAVSTDGREELLARFDGRYLSTEVAAGFTGRVLGVAAIEGEHRLRRFAYSPCEESADR